MLNKCNTKGVVLTYPEDYDKYESGRKENSGTHMFSYMRVDQ